MQAYLQACTIYSHISTTMPVNFFTTALFHISEYSHLTHTNSQCKEWIFCLLCLHKGPTLMNLNGYRIMIFETGTCGVLQSQLPTSGVPSPTVSSLIRSSVICIMSAWPTWPSSSCVQMASCSTTQAQLSSSATIHSTSTVEIEFMSVSKRYFCT